MPPSGDGPNMPDNSDEQIGALEMPSDRNM